MINTQNNPEKITTAFQNGSKSTGTNTYIVKEADVTSTDVLPVPTALRTSLPFKGVDFNTIGQIVNIEGGAPVKMKKGELFRTYDRVTKDTIHYILCTGDDAKFFPSFNRDIFIKEIEETEKVEAKQTPAPALEADI